MRNFIIMSIIIMLIPIGFGCWIISKKINYYFGYENQVKETVRELVKSECLIKENK